MSSLGQPLRAEIELTSVSKDEVGALVAKLASAETFRQANVDFHPALLSLRFTVEQRGGRQYIRITSTQPLNEPFVDMLLELGGPHGRMVREYTFLLDPADLRATQSAQLAPQAAPRSAAPKASQPLAAPSAPVQQAAPIQKDADAMKPVPQAASPKAEKPAPSAEANGAADVEEYRVKNGDSLAKIANQFKSSGVSLDQMLVALYRANPDAFIGKNMNRLRAGHILSLPSDDAARGISRSEARNIVVAQSADFKNYRNKLAGLAAATAPEKAAESKQSAGGRITAKVEEPATPASESQDKLKLSRANPAANAGADKAGAAASVEDKIAKDKAMAEADARVKELEKNVGDLQKILEVKNKNLAEQQKQAESSAAAPAPAAESAPAVPTGAPASEQPAEAKAEQAAPAPAAPANTAPAPKVAKPKPAVPAPAPEPSFVDELQDNPAVLPGAGILLAVLGALGIYSARRKKQKHFEDSIITDSSLKANSLFGSTGGQSVDTNNSVFNSNFVPSASQLDSNEVDPVAEADVYIAYGRDAQAEEILKEALRTQPDRNAVRVKLLEIYSNRKDRRAFEVLATELYGLTKGQGDDWLAAAALGAVIDPNNPLYAAGKSAKGANAQAASAQPMNEQSPFITAKPDAALETISDLEADTSYFSNTAPAAEMPKPVAQAQAQPAAQETPNELDFNLESADLQNVEVPNTIPHPASPEPSVDLASIDFDFLQAPKPAAETTPASEPAINTVPEIDLGTMAAPAAPEVSTYAGTKTADDDLPSLSIDFPGLSEAPNAEPAKPESAPMDFDLSEISLELDPAGAEQKPDLMLDTYDAFGAGGAESSSTEAEMATKLDLAIAYQEIGDKEGARELLDEVVKGGSAEQSQKAKSLLLELA